MPEKIIAANWKMNLNLQEALTLASELGNILQDEQRNDAKVIIAPPFLYLQSLKNLLESNSKIDLAAQNCSEHSKGAFTGEVAASMLASVGTKFVIVGHSERRLYYHETHQQLTEKVNRALENNLKVIFCCGETLEIREKKEYVTFVQRQIEGSLFHLPAEAFGKIVIAYEPVWAIGTGKTASSEQAQEMHKEIRTFIAQKYGEGIAADISILYGGSVNAANAAELFAAPDVDGALVGGASLKAREFVEIVKAMRK
ncbi:MAG: triose-phosphate isomerase [Raineya sp.]